MIEKENNELNFLINENEQLKNEIIFLNNFIHVLKNKLSNEDILIFENGEPIKLVDSMEKFHKYKDEHPDKIITWLSYELE